MEAGTEAAPAGKSAAAAATAAPALRTGAVAAGQNAANAASARMVTAGLTLTEAEQVVTQATKHVIVVHETSYTHIMQTHENALEAALKERQLRCLIKGRNQLLLMDPPYNTRREFGTQHAVNDVFEAADFARSTIVFRDLLRPGGHSLIFCSYKQWGTWAENLRAC